MLYINLTLPLSWSISASTLVLRWFLIVAVTSDFMYWFILRLAIYEFYCSYNCYRTSLISMNLKIRVTSARAISQKDVDVTVLHQWPALLQRWPWPGLFFRSSSTNCGGYTTWSRSVYEDYWEPKIMSDFSSAGKILPVVRPVVWTRHFIQLVNVVLDQRRCHKVVIFKVFRENICVGSL